MADILLASLNSYIAPIVRPDVVQNRQVVIARGRKVITVGGVYSASEKISALEKAFRIDDLSRGIQNTLQWQRPWFTAAFLLVSVD